MTAKSKQVRHPAEYQCQACGATSAHPRECCGELMARIDDLEKDFLRASEDE